MLEVQLFGEFQGHLAGVQGACHHSLIQMGAFEARGGFPSKGQARKARRGEIAFFDRQPSLVVASPAWWAAAGIGY